MNPSPPPLRPQGVLHHGRQPILHYEHKRVLHSARRSGLHDEQREFFSTPRRTHAPLYVTRVLAHARWRGCRGSHTSWGMCPGGKPPVYSMPPRNTRGSHFAAAPAAGNFYPLAKRAKLPKGRGVSKRRSRGVAISGSPILRRRAAPTGCKVPDGVSHLFPCTAGALFPEANSLLLPLPCVSGRSRFPTPRMRGATAIASAWTHRDTDAGTTRPHPPTNRNPWNG